MNSMCFFLVGAALIALQGVAVAETVDLTRGEIANLNIIGNVINKLNQTVQKVITDTVHKIIGLKNAIKKLSDDMIDAAKKQFENFLNGIFRAFEKIRQDAEALGVDVNECIVENEREIRMIAGKMFLDTTACITVNMMSAFEILDEAVRHVKAIILDVSTLEKEFRKCEKPGCYIKMGAKASKLLISLPLRATKLFFSSQQTIILIQLEITACVGQKFLELQKEIIPALDDVNQCIANKIGGKS